MSPPFLLFADEPTSCVGRSLGALVGLILPSFFGWLQFRLLGLRDPRFAAAASRRAAWRRRNRLHDDDVTGVDHGGTTTVIPVEIASTLAVSYTHLTLPTILLV